MDARSIHHEKDHIDGEHTEEEPEPDDEVALALATLFSVTTVPATSTVTSTSTSTVTSTSIATVTSTSTSTVTSTSTSTVTSTSTSTVTSTSTSTVTSTSIATAARTTLLCRIPDGAAIVTIPVRTHRYTTTIRIETANSAMRSASAKLRRFLSAANRAPNAPASAGNWTTPTVTHATMNAAAA